MSEAAAALAGDNGGAGDNAGAQEQGAVETGNESGQQSPSWTEGLSESSLALVQNKGWDNLESVLTSYSNVEKFAGGAKNLVELPGHDADQQAMDSFFNKLGRPESADGYEFAGVENGDSDLDSWYRSTVHKYGLTEQQAAGLFDEYNEMLSGRSEAMQEAALVSSEEQYNNLVKEWGNNFQKNMDAGTIAAQALGYDKQALEALESKLGTADMLKLFSTIGSRMGEDSFHSADKGGDFSKSSAQSRQELETLKSDKQFMDAYLAGDKSAVSKYTRLVEKAYSNG